MAWQLQGEWIESCSCDMFCACNWGPQGKASRGWCSAAIGLAIRQGNSDGVDLSNVRVVLAADFPGNFNLGNGVGRVYLDEGMSDEQRQELEAIISGQKGGVFEGLGGEKFVGRVEPFLLTLENSANSGPRTMSHTGHEFVFCLRGELEYQVERQIFPLQPGDSLLFAAHLKHKWRNPGRNVAAAIIIISGFEEGEELHAMHWKKGE